MTAYFSADGIQARYGHLQVLWDVDLHVQEGETVVLLGPNGAGKTTLLKALVGLIPLMDGQISLAGRRLESLGPEGRFRAGIRFMSETGVFLTLSIEENLRIGGMGLRSSDLRRRIAELYETFPDLGRLRRLPAGSLSGGQRKMLGVARAIVAPSRLLILDEPSAGLSPLFVKEVVTTLGRIKGSTTMLVAEQNVAILDVAERGYVLEGGRMRFEGTIEELRGSDVVQRAYFGLGVSFRPGLDRPSP